MNQIKSSTGTWVAKIQYMMFFWVAFIVVHCVSFSPSPGLVTFVSPRLSFKQKSVVLHNVPPQIIDEADPQVIKDAADRAAPPQNFYVLQKNSVTAARLAVKDGHKRLEIEFPPLPQNVLEMDDVSAYDVAQANVNLAIEFAKGYQAAESAEGKKDTNIKILLPDEAERKIAIEALGTGGSPVVHPNIEIGSLRRSQDDDDRVIKLEQTFLSLFGGGSGGLVRPYNNTDMYIICVASAQELPDVEELLEMDPNAIYVTYNLKLDVLRGDLGAPAFPPKAFQDRFLSTFKPVYYLRTRQYTRSTAQPPFMVNYQGCLFRQYPGQYQTLLDTGDGRAYRRVGGNDIRPALGEFKEELTNNLKVEGIIEEENKMLSFLRTGYKTTTWWEEERPDASDAWRT